uniref:Variant surface glycoprotein 1125.1657 n=1 Tax=Trypanosoma brucei TaxID=5691 RepID=A0A1J0R7N4_9TRYP|nr:variant surface glycoprotein 1125.1657 [Trypanosoma brucei]
MQLSVVKNPKTGQLHKCVLCVAAVALIIDPRSSEAAAATDGSNSYIFKHFCTVVNALDAEPKHKETTPDLDGVLKAATTIKLLFNNRQEVEATADTDGETQQAATTGAAQAANPCNGNGKQSCQEAKKFQSGLSAADKEVLVKFIQSKSNIAKEANSSATELVQAATRIQDDEAQANYKDVKAKLQTALFGQTKMVTGLLSASDTSRTQACGAGTGTAAKGAKEKMAVALLCLCGSDAGGCTSCKTCGATPTGTITFGDADRSADTAYATLAAQCKADANKHERRPLSAQLQEAAAALRQDLLKLKSTGHKAGFIGGVNSNQANGACDGKSDSGSGACVFSGDKDGQPQLPVWLELIDKAAAEATKAEEFVASTKRRYSQLIALNKTLTTLLVTGTTAFNQVATLQQTATGTQTPTAAEKNEKDCNAEDKEPECKANPKCKWDGEAKPPKKKCTLSEEGKQKIRKEAVNAGAENQTGRKCFDYTTKRTVK